MTSRWSTMLRGTAAVAAIAIGGVVFAGCGKNADALGREACADVDASLSFYAAAQHATSSAIAANDRAKAAAKLHVAESPAALAGSSDGDWQALMTTVSEGSRVNEGLLVTALRAQCAGVVPSS